jgi:branched-chain amino acid transport system substrate-binding protein
MTLKKISRRDAIAYTLGVSALSASSSIYAQARTVKIGTVVPLSGPWASIGQNIKAGAEFAIDEINAAGGIKSLGGLKLELVAADAEDSVEKAKNAAQRLLAQEPNLVGGFGDAAGDGARCRARLNPVGVAVDDLGSALVDEHADTVGVLDRE